MFEWPGKHGAFTGCSFNVGPPSSTLAQHWNSNGWMPRISWGVNKYCFTSLSAQSWQYRDRREPEAGNMPYSYIEWLQGFFIVHSTIGSIVHSTISLEHCICTTTNNHDDKYPVRPGFEPGTFRLNTPVDTNEPSRPAVGCLMCLSFRSVLSPS